MEEKLRCTCVTEEVVQGSHGETVVLIFHGRITLGQDLALFHDKVSTYIKAGHKHLALGFHDEQTFLDSIGHGWLVEFCQSLRKKQGSLVVFTTSRKILHVMLITKLYTVIPLFRNKEAVLLGEPPLDQKDLLVLDEFRRKEKR